VRDDVQQVRVSPDAALDVYGVVLRGGEVDVAATGDARQKLRRRRASGAGLAGPIGTSDLSDVRRLDDNLAVRDDGSVLCVHCGTTIGPLTGGAFVSSLTRRESAPTEAGPHIWHDPLEYVDAEIVVQQLCCPGCLTAVNSRVVPVDHPLPAERIPELGVNPHHDELFIGGQWVAPRSTARFTAVGSATEEVPGSVPEGGEADIDAAVAAARAVFDAPEGWSTWEPPRRADALERLAQALERRRDAITRAVSVQNGMTIALAEQVEGVLPTTLLRYYAGLIRDDSGEDVRQGMLSAPVDVRREALGVVAAIVPWNAPQLLSATKYAAGPRRGVHVRAEAVAGDRAGFGSRSGGRRPEALLNYRQLKSIYR
jgi:hypothetical protein